MITFSNGLIATILWKYVEYPWKRYSYDSMRISDAIVVLSSGRHFPLGNTNIVEWVDPDRFVAGIELYKAGKSNKLIFTGGVNPFFKNIPLEGEIYIKEATSLGIPMKDLSSTGPVINTYQEAKAIRKKLDEMYSFNQKNIILVTSAFHMNRSKRIFEAQGINVQPYPVDFKSDNRTLKQKLLNPIFLMPSANNLNKSSHALKEIIGRLVYKFYK